MGKKNLNNVKCLHELIEQAPVRGLRSFASLPENIGLLRGFDWQQPEEGFRSALIEHVRHLRSEHREMAEREALRLIRIASAQGAKVLSAVSEQLNDAELIDEFHAQDGGEIGRAIWMRAHSPETTRIFEIAESVLNTSSLRGLKRLFDAFDVPGDEPPPFIWNDSVKATLETRLTESMRLADRCEVVHIVLGQEGNADDPLVHYLVVRFAGDQVTALRMVNRLRESFCYYPARDATLVYSPSRRLVEVCADTTSSRSQLANVLSQHGFKRPLSSRPLSRFRYDLSPFSRNLDGMKPQLSEGKVERLRIARISALLGHASDEVSLTIDSGREVSEVIAPRWSNHPFAHGEGITAVTLVADLVLNGDSHETPLVIEVADPGRCSLQGEKNERLRRMGLALLEYLRVLKPLKVGTSATDPDLLRQAIRLMEMPEGPIDGFVLDKLGMDIESLADEGILTEGERIAKRTVEVAQGESFDVPLNLTPDGRTVTYTDPLSGNVVSLPAQHARRWKLDRDWLREEIITALGSAMPGPRGQGLSGEEPVYLGELTIDDQKIPVHFASHLDHERHFGKVDATLRSRPRPVAGILLTTTSAPLPFAGTNVIVPVDQVLARTKGVSAVDLATLGALYRHGQMAALGGTSVRLSVSADGQTATLSIPGKAPWQFSGPQKIVVLQRLVNAYHASTPHVNTKILMEGTGCSSPANLFGKNSPWREYLVKVEGARAWQLKIGAPDEPIVDSEPEETEARETENQG